MGILLISVSQVARITGRATSAWLLPLFPGVCLPVATVPGRCQIPYIVLCSAKTLIFRGSRPPSVPNLTHDSSYPSLLCPFYSLILMALHVLRHSSPLSDSRL
jgi:hypothetical protein